MIFPFLPHSNRSSYLALQARGAPRGHCRVSVLAIGTKRTGLCVLFRRELSFRATLASVSHEVHTGKAHAADGGVGGSDREVTLDDVALVTPRALRKVHVPSYFSWIGACCDCDTEGGKGQRGGGVAQAAKVSEF